MERLTAQRLQTKILEFGASEVGFFKIDNSPNKGLCYGISVVLRLSDAVLDEVEDGPTFSYFHHYRTVNAFLDSILLKTGLLLQTAGYRYFPIPASQSIPASKTPYSGLFSHKAGARLAGLGAIGKSALFLSNRFGARVRLGTVFTDMVLPLPEKIEENFCGSCNLCVKRCPAQAITGAHYREGMAREELLDAAACSTHMKTQYQHIGRGAVCGICMSVCPKSREARR